VLLVAIDILKNLGLPHSKAAAVLEATGATRTQAYAWADRLTALLPTLVRPPGRPPVEPTQATDGGAVRLANVATDTLRYLYDHPGAARHAGQRLQPSSGFKRHVVELCARHREQSTEKLAAALGLSASTLREWLRKADVDIDVDIDTRGTTPGTPEPEPDPEPETAAEPGTTAEPGTAAEPGRPEPETATAKAVRESSEQELQLVLDQYRSWEGSFSAFCEHVATHHAVCLGRTAIASVLEQAGVRRPAKRPGRSPDEHALRHSFVTFFPGAQWTADGTEVTAVVDGQRYVFNLQLSVDTYSAAAVGIDVRDHEDAAAVIASFDEGTSTTGSPPIAFLLDNKACNFTSEVDAATGDTLCIPATLGRPQNKAHVEGCFGLFSQQVPALVLGNVNDPKELARQLIELVVRTFFNTLNMRPRTSRGGRSRIALYTSAVPTAEQVEHAKAALQARLDKQRKSRRTLRERLDPNTRTAVAAAFGRFKFDDPTGNTLDACAGYPLRDVLDGIAIFQAKQNSARLPVDLDLPSRYLLGIISNRSADREAMALAEALWDERIRARERIFARIETQRDTILSNSDSLQGALASFVEHAFAADLKIERHWWLTSAAEQINKQPGNARRKLFLHTARRIQSCYDVPARDREAASCLLAEAILPVG